VQSELRGRSHAAWLGRAARGRSVVVGAGVRRPRTQGRRDGVFRPLPRPLAPPVIDPTRATEAEATGSNPATESTMASTPPASLLPPLPPVRRAWSLCLQRARALGCRPIPAPASLLPLLPPVPTLVPRLQSCRCSRHIARGGANDIVAVLRGSAVGDRRAIAWRDQQVFDWEQ